MVDEDEDTQENEEFDGREFVDRRRRTGINTALLSLAFAFLVQFGGGIWWAATISSELKSIAGLSERDNRYVRERMEEIARRIDRMERNAATRNPGP